VKHERALTGPHRRWRRGVGAIAVAGLAALGAAACAPAPPPAGANCPMDSVSSSLLYFTNVSRGLSSLPPLAANGQLTCLAQGWSQYMASTGLFYERDLAALIRSPGYQGYHTLGENILRGSASLSASDMHTAWMNSPPHRANILSPAFSSVGIGVAYANGEVYATEDFGG